MKKINFGFVLDHIAEHTQIFTGILEQAVVEAHNNPELRFKWDTTKNDLLASEAYNAFLRIGVDDAYTFESLNKINVASLYLVSPDYKQQIMAEISKYQAITKQTSSPNPVLNPQPA